jgi:hypothetical protein
VGHRRARALAHRISRRQRERLTFDGKVRDVPTSAAQVTARIEALRQDPGARVRRIGTGRFGNPIFRIDVPAAGQPRGHKALRVLVSSWLHGNEPVGPEAALRLVDRALRKKDFRRRFDLSVIVKVDPWKTRERPDGVNLNRRFLAGLWTAETRAIRRAVAGESFDLAVDLHGTTRDGFFLIRGRDDGKLSRRILGAMKTAALLDASPQDPRRGPYNLHSLGGASSATAGTFKGYMASQGVPYSYTLEAPRSLAPRLQVDGMFKLLRSTLDNVARYGRF